MDCIMVEAYAQESDARRSGAQVWQGTSDAKVESDIPLWITTNLLQVLPG